MEGFELLNKILNIDYYKNLLHTFAENIEFNASLLPISIFSKINLSFIKKAISKETGFDIIIKIPNYFDAFIDELYINLYLFMANNQFYENYLNPEININDLVVRKYGKKNKKYKIIEINENLITLIELKRESVRDLNGPAKLFIDKKKIFKEFVPIKRPLRQGSLDNYLQLFSVLTGLDIKKDYFPTKFDIVTIFIGSKKLFESFRSVPLLEGNLYNSIPCYYINKEGRVNDTLGISPLLYFVPSYKVAYQHIIKNKEKISNISNIVLLDNRVDELQQIINDQSSYGFRIVGICTSQIEKSATSIIFWEWHKEEINLIQSL